MHILANLARTWSLRRFSFLLLAAAWLLAPRAQACDPKKILFVGIAPAVVSVPVGGAAKVFSVITCRANSDDFDDGATTSTGGTIGFEARLVDVDGGLNPNDVLGSKAFKKTIKGPFRSFAFPVSVKWDSTLTCPIGNQQVQGDPDASAEGEPGCADAADLAVQADNGDSTSSVNLFAGNAKGETVDACCVPLEEEEVGTDYRTSNALRIGGLYLGTICDDPEAALAEARYTNRLAKRPPCPDAKDHVSQALGVIIQGFASGVTSVQSDEGMQAAGISMPEELPMEVLYQPYLTHESKDSEPKGGRPGSAAKGEIPEGTIVILGAAPWVPAIGEVDRAGNVAAAG